MSSRRGIRLVAAAMVVALLPMSAGARDGEPGPSSYAVEVLSSPPDLVSGDAARIEITAPPGAIDKLVVEVNGDDATSSFTQTSTSTLEGVVDGLTVGDNLVEVFRNDNPGKASASIMLTNHPITGPMFSGPHQEPFLCSTAGHRGNAELGPAIDEDCSTETVVTFKYRTTSGVWADYDPDAPAPADMSQTTTMTGDTVDYIVRWERGTINRFIYSIAVLSPNGQDVETPDLSTWNERLIYYFQGGVGIGHYQGSPSGSRMLFDHGLGLGYAVAYSTGTKTGEHYNLQLGGETAIMVKDRFVTEYGDPFYTVGIGASGGAIQQYVYGQNHEGLIDAAIPVYSYPDMLTQTIHVGDCELLERWIDFELFAEGNLKWADWSARTHLEGMNALNGFQNDFLPVMPPGFPAGSSECVNGWRGLSPLALNPHFGTAPGISPEDQASTEWTHYGDAKNIYGVAADGFAASTWDNVGVQYGLEALTSGFLTIDEFIDLNANAGSWKNEPEMVQEGCPFISALCPDPADLAGLDPVPDIWPNLLDPWSMRNMSLSPDGGVTPAPRKTADPGAVENAYENGHVNIGDIQIPIIDWRNYLERELDMHNSHQSFASRQRLLNFDGDASNQVIWFTDGNDAGDEFDQTPMAFAVIEEWMQNIADNPRAGVAANKPAAAVDSCFDDAGDLIYAGEDAWDGILDDSSEGPCAAQFEIFSNSRIVAGGPISGDIFKCHLQSVHQAARAGVYGDIRFTSDQIAQLQAIFPQGVCNYARGDALRP